VVLANGSEIASFVPLPEPRDLRRPTLMLHESPPSEKLPLSE
jgi:hypothetical protein